MTAPRGYILGGAEGFKNAATAASNGLDHRDAQGGFQGGRVDGHAFARRLVHHVQTDHHGRFQVQQFEGQFQAASQLRGVQHIDDDVPVARK